MVDPARLLDPGIRACPYPLMDELRQAEPVWVDGRPAVVFGSDAACRHVLHHPDVSSNRDHSLLHRQHDASEMPSFLFMDPPEHTRLRRLAATAFTPRLLRRIEPVVRELIDDLIDDFVAGRQFDAMDAFASPLPVMVICHMLGVDLPEGDWRWYRHRSALLGQAVDPYPALAGTAPPGFQERQVAERELVEFFTTMLTERRAHPREDLMSKLVTSDAEDRPTDDEIVTTYRLLLNAGHETTVNLLANGLRALVQNPHHLTTIRADASFADTVVDETLRTDPPLQMVHRYAAADLDVLGTHVPRGTTIVLLLAAANRDTTAFGEPSHFDPRKTQGHLGFGAGQHFCLGAPLARLEGRLAFTRFARRVDNPQLCRTSDTHRYRPNIVLRGLDRLDIRADRIYDRRLPW